MNPVLMILYNQNSEQLELSKRALDSVFAQDVGDLLVTVVNNGSDASTWAWLSSLEYGGLTVIHLPQNTSPLAVANRMLEQIFQNYGYLLGVPNDVVLPANCYRQMLKWPRGFVCASDNGQNHVESVEPCCAVSENTPMAVMLTRKWAYDAIVAKDGYYFDEGFFHYASDCDLALRMAACGIRGVQLNIPFWHHTSATLRLADSGIRRRMEIQADEDRAYFERKWGFTCTSLEYGQVAADPNWRAESQIQSQSLAL